MRTTLNIEKGLLERASELTGIKETTTLVKLGLEALIAKGVTTAVEIGEVLRADPEGHLEIL